MTSLQKQLAAIAATSTHQLDLRAQKAAHGKSLLFESRVAASQSFESLFQICYEGFRDLCALDPRFTQFSRSLFSEQSKIEDRTQMTQKENIKLDSVLEAFMTMIGPWLQLKPAEKALEWLVRRFRVHEYNTECLIFTYLPYHGTRQFLALLSILPPNPPHALRFLHPYIQSPTNPPRRTIIYTAVNTPAFFNSLQNHMVKVLDAGHQGPSLISFWSGVTTQAIDSFLHQSSSGRKEIQTQKTEELLLRVLPVLNKCMRPANGADILTACYMIIIVLVTKGVIQDKALDSLMEAVVLCQDDETLEQGLMCLAVVAEERSRAQFPRPVTKRLLKIPTLTRTLVSLSERCRVNRLALGCALGAFERIGGSTEKKDIFQEIVTSSLLDESELTLIASAVLQSLQSSAQGSPQHSEMIDYAAKLANEPVVHRAFEAAAKRNDIDIDSLGLSFGNFLQLTEDAFLGDEDEAMLDAVADENNTSVILPPDNPGTSFLGPDSARCFHQTLSAFEKAVHSNQSTQFLASDTLQRPQALKSSLFFSFLACVWCSATPLSVRSKALRSASSVLKTAESPPDLQNLIPYLLYALADPEASIRRSAAACVAILSTQMPTSGSKSRDIWGSSDLYGKESMHVSPLSIDHASSLLSLLFSIKEECVMDPNFVITSIKDLLEGTHSTGASKSGLKASSRGPILSFLGTHVATTPVLAVRIRLLSLFRFLGKSSAAIRMETVLPIVRVWGSLSPADMAAQCENENINATDADRAHLDVLMPREPESVGIIQDIISGKCNRERTQLLDIAFDWLTRRWSSVRSESRLVLSQHLLDLALKESEDNFDGLIRMRALEFIRSVKLDTPALVSFLDSIHSFLQMPEGPPAKKRRRTSRSEMARSELQSPEDVSRLLKRLTLVLELIEGANPSDHLILFKNLFSVLGELQQLKQQSGSDLVYLQSLVLGSLTPIVARLKTEKDTAEYQATVRADLLIDCIRHSTSPQVQNAALLLIATLASWVPELILQNLMPIFTFIGSTLLRQQDDYSAHVVDQTISRVVPQLATSLRAKHKNFLTGVADLLLSFTAAFEHIPQHRRLKLFAELARTLGPEDSLSAIIALLVDRYPLSKSQRRFTTELLLLFDPVVTLQTFKAYLDLIEDAAASKHKISETLFSLKEKLPRQVEGVVNNLLTSLAALAGDGRVRSHVGRAFRKNQESNHPRATFASIVESIIRISKMVAQQQDLYQCCSSLLGLCLELLPTADLVKSTELLLFNPDQEVRIAAVKSLEARATNLSQNDKASVSALVAFLPILDNTLEQAEELDVKRIALSCIDSIIARFGKRDVSTVTAVARTVSGPQSLFSSDDQIRILSLLCLSSIVDVLEDEAISLLPTVLPILFEYLSTAIEEENTGLHNAAFTLITNTVQRLGFMFSREYLVPALRLCQQSAASELEQSCDEEREQLLQAVAQSLDAQEVFTATKMTWADAIAQGFEAVKEQIQLMSSTVESQPKTRLVKTSATLFDLLLDGFRLRDAIANSSKEYEEAETEFLEEAFVEATIAMTLKVNDATFRPFFAGLVERESASSITFYKFLAAFFDRFKSIVTGYASYIIEPAARLLESMAEQQDGSELRRALLSALQSSFQHDQDGFWQAPSHFSAVMEPLLFQLTINTVDEEDLTDQIIPAIVDFAAASSSSTDNHRELNSVLLKYMRSEEAHTRLATVKCEQALTKKLGHEWLGLLPEMLPFISELREDDDEMVERETQRWISMLEEDLGEDLDAMLS